LIALAQTQSAKQLLTQIGHYLDAAASAGTALNLKTEMAEGESAAVIGPTRLPASRVASSYRCNRSEPESLVEPSTTPPSSLSLSVSRLKGNPSDNRARADYNFAVARVFEVINDAGLQPWKTPLQCPSASQTDPHTPRPRSISRANSTQHRQKPFRFDHPG
jgi:hypothetical protein